MLSENKEAKCSRCEKKFECKPNDISSCDCSKVELSKEEYRYISSRFKKCVCNACLIELKAECHKESHYTKPSIFKDRSFSLFFIFFAIVCKAQNYAPSVGQVGSTAIYKDSSLIVNWAKSCSITRGYQDASNVSLGLASAGENSMVIGKADGNGIVSLGDGGSAICQFEKPITNGVGYDFAVFENGFDDVFLELAFVEVSSDGINYFRFPSHSLSDTVTQTASFGPTDATKINNLAGKYRGGYGTPFDLQDLAGTVGLDLNHISHVKIIDVVGSVNNTYASRDSYHNKINDPWPTPFPSSGFDLDAVGVIHENEITSVKENKIIKKLSLYPNPCVLGGSVMIDSGEDLLNWELSDSKGFTILSGKLLPIETKDLSPGLYLLRMQSTTSNYTKKLVIL